MGDAGILTEEQEALRDSVSSFVAKRCSPTSTRELLEHPANDLPPFWSEMAGLGWLGMHLPEAYGGLEQGLLEVAIVLQEIGWAGAPGPILPTILTSALIHEAGTPSQRESFLPALADGTSIGSTALEPGSVVGEPAHGGDLRLRGSARPVLGALDATLFLIPAVVAGDVIWCLVPRDEVSVRPLTSLDPTRPVGEIDLSDHLVPHQRQLPPLTTDRVRELAALLVAAEAVGGAGWCVHAVVEYAKARVAFGRPIGHFQAVKHRCADMLASLEAARAAVWGAAQTGPDNGAAALSAAGAAALAADTFFTCARETVLLLGGVGFSWEHDAHRYLRRAVSLRALIGGSARWRGRVAELALSGARPVFPPITGSLPETISNAIGTVRSLDPAEQRLQAGDAGLLLPELPAPFGCGASARDAVLIQNGLSEAGITARVETLDRTIATTVITYGSNEQQNRWVPPIARGQDTWCMLFSEPDAGSDLAAVRMAAAPVAGGWKLSGHKQWTAFADRANWGLCLGRTGPRGQKNGGLTLFVVDMTAAGIECHPIRNMSGSVTNFDVYVSDVLVPDDCVIGPTGEAWGVVTTFLATLRSIMATYASVAGLEPIIRLVAAGSGRDEVTRDTLGRLISEAQALETLSFLQRAEANAAGAPIGPKASLALLLAMEHLTAASSFGLDLMAAEGAVAEGVPGQLGTGFLYSHALMFAGGTREVQRKVVAERILGLPRDGDGVPQPVND